MSNKFSCVSNFKSTDAAAGATSSIWTLNGDPRRGAIPVIKRMRIVSTGASKTADIMNATTSEWLMSIPFNADRVAECGPIVPESIDSAAIRAKWPTASQQLGITVNSIGAPDIFYDVDGAMCP